MKNTIPHSESAQILRQKAEVLLKKKVANQSSHPSESETLKLIHELEVHQIELEMQNEELVLANEKAEFSAEKYAALYDFSPSGYFTLSTEGRIIEINLCGASILGRERFHLIESSLVFFISGKSKPCYTHFLDKVFKSHLNESCEVTLSGNGNLPVWVHLTGIVTENGEQCFVTMIDITERKRAEEKINALLAEKELILKEVHHRIRNNMNTIVCFLHLQSAALKNPSAIAALNDAENRVYSMMVLYEKLYQSVSFNDVSVKDYFPALVDQIIGNFPNSTLVKIEKHLDDFMIDANRLSSLGIIVNELLTNIMKYAFTGRSAGLVTVSASLKGNRVCFVIADNGNGLPESINFENSTGFGLTLVEMLTKQIGGSIRIERENGTQIILEFEN